MPNAIENEIELALDALAQEAVSDFNKTMKTWQEHKTPVTIEKSRGKRVVSVIDDIYAYVNFGTSVRRALLSPDWKSKTVPRVIDSGHGSGRVLAVSRAFEFPGIDARKFDETIVERINTEVLPKTLDALGNKLVRIIVTALDTGYFK